MKSKAKRPKPVVKKKPDFARRFAPLKDWKPSPGKSLRDLLMEERDSYGY